ncbi:MAG: hypothetical protein JO154_20965 [Chitinophaga sp.]|uniref:hypothetical protein n=1 Tax=Chitinophaga sp. TaxID=1869181 RepID=UPI0025B90161|nr:hypothetical protein [Chitinophaga sp.]MBV8255086.1 hypothetical protein [Chitinophaga sp.]
MTIGIKETLHRFDTFLKTECTYVYDYYDAPLSDDMILEMLGELEISDNNFFSLYSWKNGISVEKLDYSVDLSILPWGNLLSLKDALDVEIDNRGNNYWKFSLKPIFANFEGEHYLVETEETSEFYGVIYFYSPNLAYAVNPIPYFDNLESMLSSIMRFFEMKAQWYDIKKERLVFDFDKLDQIREELNPKVSGSKG